jgi:hypothetical protein
MIQSRSCGHSEDTGSLRYRRNPERCYYCWYLEKHPRIPVSDSPRGIANRARINKYWEEVRSGARKRIMRQIEGMA